jgi:UDP-glucuronate 4-epimerase
LLDYIGTLAAALGREPTLDLQPMQPGDVVATAADTDALEAAVGFRAATPLADGVRRFVHWYRDYYRM